MALYIGVMSGTSLDGLDVVIVDIMTDQQFVLKAAKTYEFSAELHKKLSDLVLSPQCHLSHFAQLDIELGQFIAQSIQHILADNQLSHYDINAIGSHGHTLFHSPDSSPSFSLQIGNGHHICSDTGITTVTDFRQRDMAIGGQGAPLVPAFHQAMLSQFNTACVVANIGGIANITTLIPNQPVIGFDTGPGNGLMNAWIQRHHRVDYDHNGEWAKQGQCHPTLLQHLLSDPYFAQASPKSTGKEYFNLAWLDKILAKIDINIPSCDVQATLLQLTAISLSQAIKDQNAGISHVYLCGGGVHNLALVEHIQQLLPDKEVTTTSALGLDPDSVEAAAFAWLAYRTTIGKPGNLSSVTGADHTTLLGAIYPA